MSSDLILENQTPAPTRSRGFTVMAVTMMAVIVIIAVVFGINLARQGQTQPTDGTAPDFTLTMLDGNSLTLSQMKGQIVVVNFWASWCGPCRDEAPALEAVWKKYKERGVMLVGVAYTDTERKAKEYIAEYGITYPNGLDLKTKISETYHIQGVPETFIVNRQGKIVEFVMSPMDEATLSAKLDKLLATN